MTRLLRLPEVMNRTGLSRSSIYRFIAKDEFPKQLALSERCIGWSEDQVQNWVNSKLKKQEASK